MTLETDDLRFADDLPAGPDEFLVVRSVGSLKPGDCVLVVAAPDGQKWLLRRADSTLHSLGSEADEPVVLLLCHRPFPSPRPFQHYAEDLFARRAAADRAAADLAAGRPVTHAMCAFCGAVRTEPCKP